VREIPVATGYAVSLGIGAVGTVRSGMARLGEPVLRLLCLGAVVVGLKFLH
jgi:multidrug transporter EmrE-like cation transporter